MFQRVGATAYKPSLDNTYALLAHLGNPQEKFKTIHIAGTNGKGSSSHMLAAALQAHGVKTGLYTSPHLKDFRERIRVNGLEVSETFVVDFTSRLQPLIEEIKPSFFEITVAMAFDWFAKSSCEWAVIEVGMGGRLDSTNVIVPEVSLITQISFDHMEFLGPTLKAIAGEKAGIIKDHVPVVISETQSETKEVFQAKALEKEADLFFADKEVNISSWCWVDEHLKAHLVYQNQTHEVTLDLPGSYQLKNIKGVWIVLDLLSDRLPNFDWALVKRGLASVVSSTGLKGRWQKLSDHPLTFCDTGHNEEGIKIALEQIKRYPHDRLHLVWGMVKDKDLDKLLPLLPQNARYYFTQPSIPRALPVDELYKKALTYGLIGDCYLTVNEAYMAARNSSGYSDFIFIGGSTFVVSEIDDL